MMAAERQGLIEVMHPDDRAWNPWLHVEHPGMTKEQYARARGMQDFYHKVGAEADVLFTKQYSHVQFGGGFQAVSRVMGIPWILDLDDDVFHVDPFNPAYNTFRHKKEHEIADIREIEKREDARPDEDFIRERDDGRLEAIKQKGWDIQKMVRRCIALADAVVVSTQELAKLYAAHRRKAGVPERVFVVENALDPVIWNQPTQPSSHPGEVWIGWAGAASHIADVVMLERVIDEILTRHPEVRFFWTRLPSPHLLRLSNKWGQRCVRLEAWSQIEHWADYYTALNFDIALAPLEDTVFTRSKSNLKWMEAGILGQAMVASDCGPYHSTIRHGVDGFLASQPYQWIEYLSLLVNDPEKRRAVGDAAKARVLSEFSLEHNAKKWVNVFETVKREYGPEIAERARELRERKQADEIQGSDQSDSEGDSASEGRSNRGAGSRSAMVGAA